MKLPIPVSVGEIAKMIGAEIIGDEQFMITGINEIHKVETGDLMFVDVERYFGKALKSAASVIILNKKVENTHGKTLLLCDHPFEAYNSLAKHYRPFIPTLKPIGDTTIIGKGTAISPNVILGEQVKIGKNCLIHPNVTIYPYVTIGDNVTIHSGTVIGKEAYYYHKGNDGFVKWHSIGEVIIEDEVEVGANCTIDKGVSGVTIVGKGTKLDNLVHIGHGVTIGEHCIIAAQAGIAGKAKIGNHVTILGQVGIAKGLSIGDNALISAQSGVSKSLKGDEWYFGSPAEKGQVRHRELAALRQLPELIKKLNKLFKKMEE